MINVTQTIVRLSVNVSKIVVLIIVYVISKYYAFFIIFKHNKKCITIQNYYYLYFLTLTIGTVAIILSLRPTKNTEAYKDKKAGWTCKNDNDCKSGHCGKFDKKDPKKYCCSMKENPWYYENDYHYKIENGQKFCTELGEGTKCSLNVQCTSPFTCGWPHGLNYYDGPICGNDSIKI